MVMVSHRSGILSREKCANVSRSWVSCINTSPPPDPFRTWTLVLLLGYGHPETKIEMSVASNALHVCRNLSLPTFSESVVGSHLCFRVVQIVVRV